MFFTIVFPVYMVGWGLYRKAWQDNDSCSNPSICFPGIGGNNMYIYILFISLRHFFNHLFMYVGWGGLLCHLYLHSILRLGLWGAFQGNINLYQLSRSFDFSCQNYILCFLAAYGSSLPTLGPFVTHSLTHSLTRTMTKTRTQTMANKFSKL